MPILRIADTMRLRFVPYGEADPKDCYPLLDRSGDYAQFMGWPAEDWTDPEDSAVFFDHLHKVSRDNDQSAYYVFDPSKIIVGDIAVNLLKPGGNELNIAFSIRPDFRKQGLAAEAIRAVAVAAFRQTGCAMVSAETAETNIAAQKSCLKAGFRYQESGPGRVGGRENTQVRRYVFARPRVPGA